MRNASSPCRQKTRAQSKAKPSNTPNRTTRSAIPRQTSRHSNQNPARGHPSLALVLAPPAPNTDPLHQCRIIRGRWRRGRGCWVARRRGGRLLLIIVCGVLIRRGGCLLGRTGCIVFWGRSFCSILWRGIIVVYLLVCLDPCIMLMVDGQTGSGKTHSMVSNPPSQVPLAFDSSP
jgi:hypothetical protein